MFKTHVTLHGNTWMNLVYNLLVYICDEAKHQGQLKSQDIWGGGGEKGKLLLHMICLF